MCARESGRGNDRRRSLRRPRPRRRLLVSTSFPRSKSFPEGRKNARAKSSFLVFFSFFFYCHLGKEKLAYLRCDFFLAKDESTREGPAFKKTKNNTRALRSNEETRDSRSKLLFIRIKFFTRARHKNDASRDGGLGNARVRRNAGHVR